MRMPVLPVLLSLAALFPGAASRLVSPCAAAQAPRAADPAGLEQAWRGCLRESYARQSPAQGRAGSQRNALDECKDREDALVAALMAGPGPGGGDAERGAERGARSLPARALAWAASVAATVVDPVSSWIAILRP